MRFGIIGLRGLPIRRKSWKLCQTSECPSLTYGDSVSQWTVRIHLAASATRMCGQAPARSGFAKRRSAPELLRGQRTLIKQGIGHVVAIGLLGHKS